MRRGVTLLELLLALALVLALSAIALPAMLATSEHKKLGSAADAIEGQLLEARAHAMVEGVSVEVRFDPASHRMQVLDTSAQVEAESSANANANSSDEAKRTPALVARSWSDLAIDEVVSVSDAKPAPHEEGDVRGVGISLASPMGLAEAQPIHAEQSSETIEFAVYLPDGSAPVAQTIWLTEASGRAMRIDIGRWTGIPSLDREPVLTDESSTETERDEQSEPEAPAQSERAASPPPSDDSSSAPSTSSDDSNPGAQPNSPDDDKTDEDEKP